MNELVSMIILAIVQGITEWFPISSSGHLVLFSKIIGYDNSVIFDVALHFGTLMAVFVYFGKDIVDMLEALFKGQWKKPEAKMAFLLIIATIPAALVGYFFRNFIESTFNSLLIVAFGFAITGMTLLVASVINVKRNKEMGYFDAFIIGCAQAIAIIPGISRSGSTISSGLFMGLDEKSALKFSFLMSIPVIFGANLLEIGSNKIPTSYFVPTLVSFVFGMLTIHILLKIVVSSRKNLKWFGIYALLLAISLLIWIFFFS